MSPSAAGFQHHFHGYHYMCTGLLDQTAESANFSGARRTTTSADANFALGCCRLSLQ